MRTTLTLIFFFPFFGFQLLAEKPNVIVIISDDQGWADIGYNNPKVYSPNLDKLAVEGAVFTNHYVMPQCTPTRVALMTGRYPGRFGPQALQASNAPSFPKGTPTLASMFKESGYETFLCGKWHMGSTPEHGPNHFGFDHSYGCLTGAVGMYDHRYRKNMPDELWHRDHEYIEGAENGIHVTDLMTREAISIIKAQREKPFFLYLAYNAVHTPLDERGPFTDRPTQLDPDQPDRWLNEEDIQWFNDPEGKIQQENDPEKRLFLAAVHHLDHSVGEVVEALEKSGQRKKTLILFSSDNGPQSSWIYNIYPDDLELTDFNQPLPMRGTKLDVWEGGIHVPAFANWPTRIAPKKISDPVHIVDWFPTLANLIDNQQSQQIPLDGFDFSKAIFEGTSLDKRDIYWIWSEKPNRWALRYGKWKIVKYGEQEPDSPDDWQLYDLSRDPKEDNSLSSRFPKIAASLHERFLLQRSKDQK